MKHEADRGWRRVHAIVLNLVIFVLSQDAICQSPIQPSARTVALGQAVLIQWNDSAQHASPFSGYRLFRGRLPKGPFSLIRQWRPDVLGFVPNQFFDVGDDNGDGILKSSEGLSNEIEYFYRVSAFADSASALPVPFTETYSATVSAIPYPSATDYSTAGITLLADTGYVGDWKPPRLVVTNPDIFNRIQAGHTIHVSVSTVNSGVSYVFPVVVTDPAFNNDTRFFADMSLSVFGDSASSGVRSGSYGKENLFGYNSLAIQLDWSYDQLRKPLGLDSVFVSVRANDSTDTPVLYVDTSAAPNVGLVSVVRTLGEKEYEMEFFPGGIDTVDLATKKIYRYYDVRISELHSGITLQPGGIAGTQDVPEISRWTITRYTLNSFTGGSVDVRKAANRYYLPSFVDSTHNYLFANLIFIEGVKFACDYSNQGGAPGKKWPHAGRRGTRDFSVGDKIVARVSGGVRGLFPLNAYYTFSVAQPQRVTTTTSILDQVHIVPNPYVVRHEAQHSPSEQRIFFQDLPEECTIRIYTVALDPVRTIYHHGGGVDEWDLRNDRGNLVASQLFIAIFEAPNGVAVKKKFAVVRGE